MIKILSNTNRIVYAICKCILFPESSVLIPFKDEESAKEAFKIAKKLCNKDVKREINKIEQSNISFKNKSNLSFDYSKPKVEPKYIRGQRSKLPIWYDDFYISDEVIEDVLKPYMNNNKQ